MCEIGIYHGRLFILLYLLLASNESATAIDLFSKQELNVKSSGCERLDSFKRHLEKWAKNTDRMQVIEDDSTKLSPTQIMGSSSGKFRLFSVDGGHSAKNTESDLWLASETLTDGGVIFLDDYFNEIVPGVSEGTLIFLQKNKNIAPFLIGANKLLLTQKEFAPLYLWFFQSSVKGIDRTLLGHPLRCIGFAPPSDLRQRLVNTKLWEVIRPLIKVSATR